MKPVESFPRSVRHTAVFALLVGASACNEKTPAPAPDDSSVAAPHRGWSGRRASLRAPGRGAQPDVPASAAPTADSPTAVTSASAAPPASLASPRDRALGIFVVSRRLDGPTKALDDAVYGLDAIDGVYAQLLWSSLQPEEGKLDWTTLDRELSRAIAHGKSLTLSVAAGDATPDWVFKAGAKKLDFQVAHHNGKGGAPLQKISIAAPWDPVFLAKWKSFVEDLAAHLHSTEGGYEHVRIVKITGINESSSETRLPAGSGANAKGLALSDNVKKWMSEGYRPSKVLDAYKAIVDDFATSFPDKALGLEILDAGGFPLIDETGGAKPPGDADGDGVTRELVDFGASKYKAQFVVQSNGLRATSPEGQVSGAAKRGVYVGFQTNDWLGAKSQHGVGCGSDEIDTARDCTEEEFAQVLDRGIALGGHYVEVFPYDAITFPKVIASTHQKLISPRRP